MSYSPMADDLLDLMPRLITLKPYLGVTGNGVKSWDTARQYHAYITADSKAVYVSTGQTVFSTSVVIFHPKAVDGTVLTAITPDAELTLPDGTKPRILTIGGIDDEIGVTCFEIRT